MRSRLASFVFLAIPVLFFLPCSNAGYAWFSAPSGTDSYSVVFNPQIDPGPASNVYWASQFYTTRDGGYFGLQTTRQDGNRGLFLWSVWSATSYVADGSSGSFCSPFEEDGTGYTCRIWHSWTQGFKYRFNMSNLGNAWHRLVVTELETGLALNLGKIQFDGTITGGVNWVEYFDWNDRSYDWNGAPLSKLAWSDLKTYSASGGSLPYRPKFSSEDKDMIISGDGLTALSYANTMRSTEVAVRNQKTGRCLAVGGTAPCPPLVSWTPPSRDHLWTLTNNSASVPTQIRSYSSCLFAAPNEAVTFNSPCGSNASSPATGSAWLADIQLSGKGSIRSVAVAGKCLADLGGGQLGLAPCNSTAPGKKLIFNPTISRPFAKAVNVRLGYNRIGAQFSEDGGAYTKLAKPVASLRAGRTSFFVAFDTNASSAYSTMKFSANGALALGTINPTVVRWSVANTTGARGKNMVFRFTLNAPAPVDTWTCITTDNSAAPHVANFYNDASQASLDGSTWNLVVYYGNCVVVPAKATSLFIRLAVASNSVVGETVKLTATEGATGIFAGPYLAVGRVM